MYWCNCDVRILSVQYSQDSTAGSGGDRFGGERTGDGDKQAS